MKRSYIKYVLVLSSLLFSCKKEEEISPNDKFIGFYDAAGTCNIISGPTVVAVKKFTKETVSIVVTDQMYQETLVSSDGIETLTNLTYKTLKYPECSIVIDSTNKAFYVGKIIDKSNNRILGRIQNSTDCVNDFSDIIIVFDFNDGNKALRKVFVKRKG
jgi:hypothetical protein